MNNNEENEENDIEINIKEKEESKHPDMIGTIKIEKINLELPILSHYTEELMKVAPTRYAGPNPNCVGNLVIIGHNYYDNTHFSNLNKLTKGDKIIIRDINGIECVYKVCEKEVIAPTDFSCLEYGKDIPKSFVTLVTCTNGTKNRLVIKCEEV